MIRQIRRSLQHLDTARGHLHVLINLVVQLAHFAMLQQDFLGAQALVGIGQSADLSGQAGDFTHVFAQIEIKDNQTGGHLLAQHLGKTILQLLDLGLDNTVKFAVVKGLQRLGMDADVAQHEFRPQQTHFKLGMVAQTRKEERLAHIGQHQAHFGLCRRQFRHIHFAAHLMQGQQAAVDPPSRTVHGHFRAVQGAQHVHPLNADDRRYAQFARRDGGMAGVAAHVRHDGGGHAHTRHHVRICAFSGQHVALGNLIQLKGGAQKTHRALTRPA